MRFFFAAVPVLLLLSSCRSASDKKFDEQIVTNAVHYAHEQYPYLMKQTPPDKFPKTFEHDTVRFSNSEWWCSGFYSGNLFRLFTLTEDSLFYNTAIENLKYLEKEQYNTSTHDLGFMMYNSFGKLYTYKRDTSVAQILMQSAKSLAGRYSDTVKAIRSWNSRPDDFLVIIDNMMNLELLFWAARYSKDTTYRTIAINHANTTLKNHFRPDNSSYHLINYDPLTGSIKEKKTVQGWSDESAWARGQAWGLYGFMIAYRYTNDLNYLVQANKIADFILQHPRLPKDKIPYWDFDLPDTAHAPRDVSAAAITGVALLKLSRMQKGIDKGEEYFAASYEIMKNLYEYYRYPVGEGGGFLLSQSVGHYKAASEVSVPLMYADYYFLELLLEWKRTFHELKLI
ncbi:glycoside hydrolase family 88 protein [Gynurincola endophyticus]|jgi:unsaturated chondroitin disaccharide hydrolase|uniref:glycoside hydrolase family 88 protein n=1 Tax=Gynurincola endophyticus TaxID=2479004 RepID=UPI000F8CFAB5|nr:glycoside hydrolase family 88 protein [Gynurincola endophyticus]